MQRVSQTPGTEGGRESERERISEGVKDREEKGEVRSFSAAVVKDRADVSETEE